MPHLSRPTPLPRPLATALSIAAFATLAAAGSVSAEPLSRGHVYTASNDPSGNALLVYQRGPGGSLTMLAQVGTQGLGTGAGLGSQGSVTLSRDRQYAFVVNAGSRSVSTFRLSSDGATLASVVDAGGDMPISVTEVQGLVYVLDAGGDGNVAGFHNVDGVLQPLKHGIHPLSGTGVGPAQVGFDARGRTLVVTEKNTNLLTSWPVSAVDGSLGSPTETPSAGATPFGFSASPDDHLFVSEAEGGAELASTLSSYRFVGQSPRLPHVVTPAMSTTQTAACWTVVSPDGLNVYTANAGSGSVSRFEIAPNGAVMLAEAVAEGVEGSHPLDLAMPPGGQRLYVLDNGISQIATFAVDARGRLSTRSSVVVPATASGLAAD